MIDTHLLSLIMDGAVIVLLVAVIFFASRLSLYLREFRASRKDMDKLIRDLSASVEKAESAMAGLREATRDSGRDLQSMINEAKALTDELQLMSEAGNNMARRLETVAEKSGRNTPAGVPGRKEASFAIRDPEFDPAGGDDMDDDLFEEETSGLQSRAERELFEALQGTQRKKAKV